MVNDCIVKSSHHFNNILFFIAGNVNNLGLFLNYSPIAVGLNCQIISVHLNPEEPAFSPVSPPTVATNPVLNTVLLAPANNRNPVIYLGTQIRLRVYASGVLI